ncbi:MAG: tetratricopeptide repeat protein [Patescibacteria group bacterium]|nr:tetratricopeptide repeat protein [Patescibacteria group bacterium]
MLLTLFIIFIIVVLAALIYLGLIFARHATGLAAVDLEILPEEKNKEVKTEMAEKRLKRKFGMATKKISKNYLIPLGAFLSARIKKIYYKAMELERHYKRETKRQSAIGLANNDLLNHIKDKLAAGLEFLNQEKYKEAEDVLIEVISLDAKNAEAYLGLAKIYLATDKPEQAKEVYNFILKMDLQNNPALAGLAEMEMAQNNWVGAREVYAKIIAAGTTNPEYYCDYGYVLEKLDDHKNALEMYQKAVDLKPSDPRYLDYLLEESILNKKKYLAYKVFDQLKEANPENQKLDDFKKRIEEI